MQKKLIKQSVGAGFSASLLTLSLAAVGQDTVLEEVVVTATKRSASAQTIPVTIQAIGEQALEDLGVANFKGSAPLPFCSCLPAIALAISLFSIFLSSLPPTLGSVLY